VLLLFYGKHFHGALQGTLVAALLMQMLALLMLPMLTLLPRTTYIYLGHREHYLASDMSPGMSELHGKMVQST
jgi:hypothetical protein